MLRKCVQKFDVTENFENFCKILRTKQAPWLQLEDEFVTGWLGYR
jgi:hypothetical protein